jgi:hypothetical protein
VSPSASSKSEALIVTDASSFAVSANVLVVAILPADLYANCREVEAVWKATTAVNDNKSSVVMAITTGKIN